MKKNILNIIKKHNLQISDFDLYTSEILKIKEIKNQNKDSKLVLVSAMSPNKSGEGKTTNLIGIVDGLNALNHKTIGLLREPSIGPVFGMKGTGSGSNKAQIVPHDKINLHFTGDLHAITTANNLIQAVIENEIYQKSDLNIDPNKIMWNRCLDMNDRSLRDVSYNINKETRINSSFNITAASDLMALFCLVSSVEEFKEKLSNTTVAYSKDNKEIKIKDLKIENSIIKILENAFYPNLVSTLEDNPVIVHGGPFANIAHGTSSIIAMNQALNLSDIVVTESGFGADLGLEKFMNIVSSSSNNVPNLIVLMISLKSIIDHSDLSLNKKEMVQLGFQNILAHIKHIENYNIDFMCAINARDEDDKESLEYLKECLNSNNIDFEISNAWKEGSKGTVELCKVINKKLEASSNDKFKPLYKLEDSIDYKINKIIKEAYRASGVEYSKEAKEKLSKIKREDYYVCIAKNPYSLTSDPKILITPKEEFKIYISDIEINESANLLIPITGKIFRMPGLNKVPEAKNKNILKNN